jgi:hypothetical protein
MRQQTLAKLGKVEFIFVDSGSPYRERTVIEELLAETPMNVVYVRSAQRETIQSAWNRGSHRFDAKAPRLAVTFLRSLPKTAAKLRAIPFAIPCRFLQRFTLRTLGLLEKIR